MGGEGEGEGEGGSRDHHYTPLAKIKCKKQDIYPINYSIRYISIRQIKNP